MAVLGKDIFDLYRPHTHTKIQFGDKGYWVEWDTDCLPYGQSSQRSSTAVSLITAPSCLLWNSPLPPVTRSSYRSGWRRWCVPL